MKRSEEGDSATCKSFVRLPKLQAAKAELKNSAWPPTAQALKPPHWQARPPPPPKVPLRSCPQEAHLLLICMHPPSASCTSPRGQSRSHKFLIDGHRTHCRAPFGIQLCRGIDVVGPTTMSNELDPLSSECDSAFKVMWNSRLQSLLRQRTLQHCALIGSMSL